MKKQTEIAATNIATPKTKRVELVFLIVIATIIYRNQTNRRMSLTMPPNTLGFAKQALQSVVWEAEKLSTKLANLFYNITGGSVTLFQFFAIAALLALLVVGTIYIIRTH